MQTLEQQTWHELECAARSAGGVEVAMVSLPIEKVKALVAGRTRPAAPVEGLVRYDISMFGNGAVEMGGGEYVRFDQAEAIIAAERAEIDETYELGKRDGYSEAVQQIDLKTGGDGEYRYCTDHDTERHTPDPASMIQRIVWRFETLNTMESISESNEWKERAGKAEADNAALTARVARDDAAFQELIKVGREADAKFEALETQLAAAKAEATKLREALEFISGIGFVAPKDAPAHHDEAVKVASAALEAKP